MICKNCNTTLSDDSAFCSNCGTRVDGKKECPNCKKLINEESIYCNNCGTRVDGKKICSNCGNAYEGTFCDKCGNGDKVSVSKKKTTEINTCNSPLVCFAKVERILSPALLLGGILLIFIFSFFMGISYSVSGVVVDNNSYSTFDFFGKIYSEYYSNLSSSIDVGITSQLDSTLLKVYTLIPIICVTIIVAANMVVSLIMLIIASVKYGKKTANGERADLLKYFLPTFVISIATSLTILLFFKTNTIASTTLIIKTILKTSCYLAIILPSIMILSAYILRTIREHKDYVHKTLAVDILSLIKIALLVVAMFVGVTIFLSVREETSIAKLSSGMGIQNLVILIVGKYKTFGTETMFNAVLFTFISYLIFIGIIAVICITLVDTINTISNEKKNTNIAFSILLAVSFIVYMVMAIITKSLLIKSNIMGNEISIASPIVAMAFAILSMGIDIAIKVVKNKKIAQLN